MKLFELVVWLILSAVFVVAWGLIVVGIAHRIFWWLTH